MVCPRCTSDCQPDSRFCFRCGFELTPVELERCPVCSTILPDKSRYCFTCGYPIHGTSPSDAALGKDGTASPQLQGIPSSLHRLLPPQYVNKLFASRGSVGGERRVVTILFSDVKGSTALAEHLDPEEVLEIMNGAFGVLIEPITRYEGTLARLMGDAILAFFGAPLAHEDDPARACHAALDIVKGAQEYAARLEQERGVKGFNVRVGLNTGLVVVAEVGSDLRVEYTAMGDAVNLAARMETAADPGTILLTEATLEHIRHGFDVESVGPLQLKGKSKPVNTYRLVGPKVSPSAPGRFHGVRSALVGRETELRTLQDRLRDLENGTGGIVCIRGDIGVGKSRLVEELKGQLPSLVWAETRSFPYSEGVSYQTLRRMLQSLLVEQDHSGIDESKSGSGDPALEGLPFSVLQPHLSMILNPSEALQPSSSTDVSNTDNALPHVVQELQSFLRYKAAHHPLVLLWDDLQWIDPSSLRVLEGLFSMVEDVPILFLLLLRREGERMSLFHKRITESLPERPCDIALGRLDETDSAALLEHLLAGRSVPRDIQEQIIGKTDGNPMFLEEIVRQVFQHRNNVPGAGSFLLKENAGTLSLPDTLRGVIMARIDSLPPEYRSILQTASVLGRYFQPRLLKDILPTGSSEMDISRSLEELVRREFIVPQIPTASADDQQEVYAFTHSLTHEVAHDSMLLAQRKELHGRAASAIRHTFTGDSAALAEILSVHYEISGDREEAFQCLMEAGEHARTVYAHLEAINYYRRALKLAIEMGIKGAMLRNLFEGLGDVYVIAAKYPAAMEQFDQALAQQQNTRRRATLHRKKAFVYEKSGLYDDAVRSLKESLVLLDSTIDLLESAQVYRGLSRVYFLQGNYEVSIELSGLALEIMEKREDLPGIAQVCNVLGLAYAKAGETGKALEQFQRSLAICEQRNDSHGLSATYNNLGQLALQLGEYEDATRKFLRCIELCKKTGNRHGLSSAYDNIGQSLALSGRPEEGSEYLAKAISILTDIGSEGVDLVPELWQTSGNW